MLGGTSGCSLVALSLGNLEMICVCKILLGLHQLVVQVGKLEK